MIKLSRLSALLHRSRARAPSRCSIGAGPAVAQQTEAAGTVRTAVETWLKGRYKVDEVRTLRSPACGRCASATT